MIAIRNQLEIALLRRAGQIVALCHDVLKNVIRPGISCRELDAIIEETILKNDASPVFKGYRGFPNASCISVNEGVVHGIPTSRILQEGDIVSIDVGAQYKGYIGDSAWTYRVGEITDSKKYLLLHTEQALWEGLSVVKEGVHLSTISHRIGQYALKHKLGIVKELSGHGVGTKLHEPPIILNYGLPNKGPILQAGMVLAIEPILTLGNASIKMLRDGWTFVTKDAKDSAHFEHTIVVEKHGYSILTALAS